MVLNLVGRALPKADEELPAILTETLAAEVETVSGCDVVSQADILAMLDFERQKAVCTDGSDSCLAEVGQALGADRVVAGTLGKLGTDYILAARLMNVKKGAVEMRAEEPVTAAPEQLRRAAKNVGRRLFGVSDLAKDQKVDDSPLPSTTSESSGNPVLFWTGATMTGLGVAVAIPMGILAGVAESKLADPKEPAKEEIQQEGALTLLGLAGGVVLAVAGGVVLALGLME